VCYCILPSLSGSNLINTPSVARRAEAPRAAARQEHPRSLTETSTGSSITSRGGPAGSLVCAARAHLQRTQMPPGLERCMYRSTTIPCRDALETGENPKRSKLQRIGSQHASTPLWRSAASGTDGSNPSSSSKESAMNLTGKIEPALARNRRFESSSLQRGVSSKPCAGRRTIEQ
jgi:hypothetical protein